MIARSAEHVAVCELFLCEALHQTAVDTNGVVVELACATFAHGHGERWGDVR